MEHHIFHYIEVTRYSHDTVHFWFYSLVHPPQFTLRVFWVTSICSTWVITKGNKIKCHKTSLNFWLCSWAAYLRKWFLKLLEQHLTGSNNQISHRRSAAVACTMQPVLLSLIMKKWIQMHNKFHHAIIERNMSASWMANVESKSNVQVCWLSNWPPKQSLFRKCRGQF